MMVCDVLGLLCPPLHLVEVRLVHVLVVRAPIHCRRHRKLDVPHSRRRQRVAHARRRPCLPDLRRRARRRRRQRFRRNGCGCGRLLVVDRLLRSRRSRRLLRLCGLLLPRLLRLLRLCFLLLPLPRCRRLRRPCLHLCLHLCPLCTRRLRGARARAGGLLGAGGAASALPLDVLVVLAVTVAQHRRLRLRLRLPALLRLAVRHRHHAHRRRVVRRRREQLLARRHLRSCAEVDAFLHLHELAVAEACGARLRHQDARQRRVDVAQERRRLRILRVDVVGDLLALLQVAQPQPRVDAVRRLPRHGPHVPVSRVLERLDVPPRLAQQLACVVLLWEVLRREHTERPRRQAGDAHRRRAQLALLQHKRRRAARRWCRRRRPVDASQRAGRGQGRSRRAVACDEGLAGDVDDNVRALDFRLLAQVLSGHPHAGVRALADGEAVHRQRHHVRVGGIAVVVRLPLKQAQPHEAPELVQDDSDGSVGVGTVGRPHGHRTLDEVHMFLLLVDTPHNEVQIL
eukprot:Rhum_TRINITY_DN11408_c0_g1::Rhum_TRINITY_DN11408_c0_g1_i1::g.44526::m.44526